MCLHKRWLFLIYSSITYFVTEVVEDQLSLLTARLQGNAEACRNGVDTSCLQFTSTQFNGLFVTGFWAGGVAAVFSGFFIGRYGIWTSSCVTAGLLLIGTTLQTIAPYLHYWHAAFPVMLTSRFFFASGYFGNIVVSLEVISHWFWGKELALAIAVYLSCSRLATLVTFSGVGKVVECIGLQSTLWMTFGVGMVGPLSAILAAWIYYRYASDQLDDALLHDPSIRKFSLSQVKRLGRDFWILCGIIFFYFAVLFTFLIDGPKFIMDIYGASEAAAGIIIGLIPDISLFAPVFGYMIDKCGHRDTLTFVSSAIFFVGSVLILIFPTISPIFISSTVAVSYTIMTASIWSSIPTVVDPNVIGVGMGIGTGIQALASGVMLLGTGILLDAKNTDSKTQWGFFFIFMVVFSGITWLLSAVSIYYDRRDGGRRLRQKHAPEGFKEINEKSPLISPDQNAARRHSVLGL